MGNIERPLTEDEQRIEAVLVAMDRLVDAVDALAEKRDVGWLAAWQSRDQHRGAVSLSAEELHCLICAMAGNFPERFQPIRMDLLRKLAKAQRATGGQ